MSEKRKSNNPNGRPHKIIDWKLAQNLAHIQCTCSEICSVLDLDEDTLISAIKREFNLSYSDWYKKYADGGKASLRRRLFKIANDDKNKGATTAAIWLSKNYLGMKDNHEVELTAQKPIPFAYSLDDKAED